MSKAEDRLIAAIEPHIAVMTDDEIEAAIRKTRAILKEHRRILNARRPNRATQP